MAGLCREFVISRETAYKIHHRYLVADSLEGLHECLFVVETVAADLSLKRETYVGLEKVIAANDMNLLKLCPV